MQAGGSWSLSGRCRTVGQALGGEGARGPGEGQVSQGSLWGRADPERLEGTGSWWALVLLTRQPWQRAVEPGPEAPTH